MSAVDAEPDDEGKVQIIGHLLIRDADTGAVILSKRDGEQPASSADEDE